MITTIVKVTLAQYRVLEAGGTVGSHTYDPVHCFYVIDDGLVLPQDSGQYVIKTDDDGETYYYDSINLTWDEIDNKPSTFPPSAHNHSTSDITSGVFDIARIPNIPLTKITGVSNIGTTAAATIPIVTTVNSHSTNAQIPTALAVYDALALAPGISTVTTTGSGNGVTAVDYNSTSHTLTVTKGSTFSLSNHTHTAADVGALPTGTTLDSIPDGNTRKLANYLLKTDISDWAKATTKPTYNYSEIYAGNISLGSGSNYINLRTGHNSYNGGMYYSTPGNEAMVFAAKNAVTSFIFKSGLDCTSLTQWTAITNPGLQIKGSSVAINKLIADGASGTYNLDVNGTANATTIYEDGTTLTNKYAAKSHTHKATIGATTSTTPSVTLAYDTNYQLNVDSQNAFIFKTMSKPSWSDVSGKPTLSVSGNTITIGTNSTTWVNTTYTPGSGLSFNGTTINHSNSITAQTTQALYPIKIDAQGHISAYGSAVTSLPASDVYAWAKAANKPSYTADEVGAAPSHHLYHTWDNNTNYYDDYVGSRMFRIITENMYADTFRFQASTIQNLQYYDFNSSTWTSWDFNLANLFDGNARTGVSIPYANRKFRFELQTNGGWPTTGMFMLQGTWFDRGSWPSGEKTDVILETRANTSASWTQRATFTLNGVEGMSAHTLSSLHTGDTYYRITITIYPWTTTANKCPLQRLCFFSNYNGGSLEKISYDGYGNTLASTIYENGTKLSDKYLALSGGTMTGQLTVKAPIFGYGYTQSNNKAAFILDKPGSNYTGIGAHAETDTIYFGACSNTGVWVDSYKQKWKFNGTIIEDGVSLASKYAASSHTHSYSDISGISTIGTTAASTVAITTSITDSTQIPTSAAVKTYVDNHSVNATVESLGDDKYKLVFA